MHDSYCLKMVNGTEIINVNGLMLINVVGEPSAKNKLMNEK